MQLFTEKTLSPCGVRFKSTDHYNVESAETVERVRAQYEIVTLGDALIESI